MDALPRPPAPQNENRHLRALPDASTAASGPQNAARGFGLRFSDGLLFSKNASHAEKVVLAALEACPNRDLSKRQMEAALPLSENQIREARQGLVEKGLAIFADGSPTFDPASGQKYRRRRLVRVRDDLVAEQAFTYVPADVVQRIPARSGATALVLYALLLYRQKISGAAYAPTKAVANDLGLTDRSSAIRQIARLVDGGLLRRHSEQPPIYEVMGGPEWTPFEPSRLIIEAQKATTLRGHRSRSL